MGKLGDFQTEFRARVRELRAGGMEDEYVKRQIADDLVRETGDDRWVTELQAQVGVYVSQVAKVEGDVVLLKDGTAVRCRQDSSTMWMIHKPGGGKVFGFEEPTPEEKERWTAALHATYGASYGYTNLNVTYEPRVAGVPHPEGWFTTKKAYRNEADEAAVITRWRARTGR